MSSDRIDAESKVSGNQANIPAQIRRELDIDDGDHLRWQLEDDGSIRVRVIQQQAGTFADFDGYAGKCRPRLVATRGTTLAGTMM
ncbi:AbrB/MazE/SpoVT family DNA-binding domain-containing protein [Halorubrum yunnanense]|uniref:AbrB/MazE/SpoVT family DNA-binding domain-containing protein n=1 Tax=Halorubrum yunnanense TaxID=1526162 RepID=A0ABD5YHI6_9EURY|nr:AbrB/MazE/SpoVT family DNA-binding domain-containing protein [Halorubrum yunnanense]